MKSLKQMLKEGKRTEEKINRKTFVTVKADNCLYEFEKGSEKDLLSKKKEKSGFTNSQINKRSNTIQWWLSKMYENREALRYVMRLNKMPREKLRVFVARTDIKPHEMTEFLWECGVAALQAVPKTWIIND